VEYEADVYIRAGRLSVWKSSSSSNILTSQPLLLPTPTTINMKFTTAATAAVAATLATASPCTKRSAPIADGDVFSLMAIRSASPLQYLPLQAFNNGLMMGASAQNASCGPPDPNYAQFQLNNGTLYLYTDNPPQQFYVDRSGMGQGVIQYTTGAQQPVKNGERQGFTVTEAGDLVFRDQSKQDIGFQACPLKSVEGEWQVWLSSVSNPAGYEGCLGFGAKAVKVDEPLKCWYKAQ
jgi:hypothetical protein